MSVCKPPMRAPDEHRQNRALWTLRDIARRRYGLDVWVDGLQFALVDLATKRKVLVTDDLDAVRRRLRVG